MDVPQNDKPGLLERLSALLLREPGDREQLVELLHSAYQRNLLDARPERVTAIAPAETSWLP